MGIYQKVDYQSEKTTWIAIQPSAQARKNISTFQNSAADQQDCFEKKSDPMILHVQFLSAAMSAWREYLADLRSAIAALVLFPLGCLTAGLTTVYFRMRKPASQELDGFGSTTSTLLLQILKSCKVFDKSYCDVHRSWSQHLRSAAALIFIAVI